MGLESPNFGFLVKHDPILVHLGALAERYCLDDPNTALIKLRQLAESLAKQSAAYVGIYLAPEDSFLTILHHLWDRGVCSADVSQIFHSLRMAGNDAVHNQQGGARDALHQLKLARVLAVWFHKSFGKDRNFKPGPFVPPPDSSAADATLRQELDELREEAARQRRKAETASRTAEEEAQLRRIAEDKANQAYEDLKTVFDLAEETEATLATERSRFEIELQALQISVTENSGGSKGEVAIARAQEAAQELDLDEADTRGIIDRQLREAGWEADSAVITYAKGVRPQKNRNVAIAEWATSSGPADYVLFAGLTPVAIVEAKRQAKDVQGVIEQAKRYSLDYVIQSDETLRDLPHVDYKIPFLFATNGRPYLKQIESKSGVWFLDARRSTNHPRALEHWYTPEGLLKLLDRDEAEADERLQEEPSNYLDLRDYQHDAISAVENAIREGKRTALLAMATGTGKTRTCIGLVYRLVKAQRFSRVLFLVDRSALGIQATNAFKDVKLENLQSFAEIYDVKELGDITPDADTRLQVATIQGMIKRLLYPSEADSVMPVDRYDCIVIDECHRGYNLDKEMSDSELTFRSESDYISKYSRVLDHFDAVKIGLTATPALHTTEIFGPPVYQYSYRQAVIDGYLCDHEPPIRIITARAEEGIGFKVGEQMPIYDTATGNIELHEVPDDIEFEVGSFNKKVITEPFNRAICGQLAKEIDPGQPGKTLVFCATDAHADMVVGLMKEAFTEQYGSIEDNAVVKITGASDKPLELIRKLKNEKLPSVAVTVDLLSTGIDVPQIDGIVFIRRVRSRILYEQMLGRATRLCHNLYGDGEDKECFRVYDAVDLYAALEPVNSMKPVVTQPSISFVQLTDELASVEDDEAKAAVLDQLIAKLQTKKRKLGSGKAFDTFCDLAGIEPQQLLDELKTGTADSAAAFFKNHPDLAAFLDKSVGGGSKLVISDHDDEVIRVEHGYGDYESPTDYLESFKKFVEENGNTIPALLIVTQSPRDLTRKQLRELQLKLDSAGFTEKTLETAWRDNTNAEIAATIIGFVRQAALGTDLVSYEERVDQAMKKILASQNWTNPQRNWLKRITKQLKLEIVVDRESLDKGQFAAEGGFKRLNKTFDGKMESLLVQIQEEVWREQG